MSHFGHFEHHFQVPVGDHIPNIWVCLKMLGIFPMIASHLKTGLSDQQNQTGYV